MLPTIALDLDGTLANMYGVKGWLEALQAHDASPYFDAGELADTDIINALIELYKDAGGHVCVVSWTAKGDIPHAYSPLRKRRRCFGYASTCPLSRTCVLWSTVRLSISLSRTLRIPSCLTMNSPTETLSDVRAGKLDTPKVSTDF